MNTQMQIAVACVLVTGIILPGPERLLAQSPPRRQVVKAGLATLHVTTKGSGEAIVFIPSRGRGVEDFDDLSERLVRAGYEAILPEPRGIGGSTGPLDGITYHSSRPTSLR